MKKIIFLLLFLFSFGFSQTNVWQMYPRFDVQNDSFDVSGQFMTWKTSGNDSIYSIPIMLSRWTGSWSTAMIFDSLSGVTNFKIKIQMLMPDNTWLDVPDISWKTIDNLTSKTSFSGAEKNTYFFYSVVDANPFWSKLIYNQVRFKIVFTGAQRIKLWHTILYDREY